MQLSNELRGEIGDLFADFDVVEMPQLTRVAAMMSDFPYGANPDFGSRRKGLHYEPISMAFAAVFSGTFTVAAVATVISVAGTVLSVVGMITGNKTLMKIGGIMGLAGGVVGLAAGAAGGAGAAIGETAGASGGGLLAGETGAMDMGIGGSGILEEAGTAGLGAGGMTDLGAGTMPMTATEAPSLAGAELAAPGASDASGFGIEQLPATAPSTPGIGPNPPGMNVDQVDALAGVNGTNPMPASSLPGTQGQMPTTAGETAAFGNNTYTPGQTAQLAPPANVGSGRGLFDWFKNLKPEEQSKLITGVVQAGGKAIGGLFEGWSEEQKLAFEQQKWGTQQSNAKAQPSLGTKPAGGLLAASKGVA